jgi:hypothetical protein
MESSEPTPEAYNLFRKYFHVPSEWQKNEKMKALMEHRYFNYNAKEAFQYIASCLKEVGYDKNNDRMLHDYLHYMICDLLSYEGIPYLTENEIREDATFQSLFGNLTPDLIIKSDATRKRFKPCILDVYVGKKDEAIQTKKSKYKKLGITFDFEFISLHNITHILYKFASQTNVDYLYKHYNVFFTEYHYWCACLNVNKILLNDVENFSIKEFTPDEDFAERKLQFHQNLLIKAHSLLDNNDL